MRYFCTSELKFMLMIVHLRIVITCALLLLTSVYLNAQIITWQRTYGGTNMDYGYSIVQTPDEGFIAVGLKRVSTTSFMFAMRLDRFGDTLWTRTYSSNPALGIVALSDGNYAISGWYPHDPIIKIDLNGDILWAKYNEAGAIEPSRDSGFYVNRSGLLRYYNNDGIVMWSFDILPYLDSAELWDIGTFPGNDVLIIGVVHDSLPGLNRFILKVNKHGQFEFFRRFNSIYWPNRVVCPDSNSLVYSSIRDRSVFLVKYDLNGNLIWTQKLDTLNHPSASTDLEDLFECRDKGFAITGSYQAGDYDYFVRVMRTDMFGRLLWKRLYGFGDHDMGLCIRETKDSGVAVIGIRDNYNLGDIYIIKTDKSGYANPPVNISVHEEFVDHSNINVKLYPNPFNSFLTIEFDLQLSKTATIRIYDNLGREVRSLYRSDLIIGVNRIRIDSKGLPSGIYFCKVATNESVAISKMLLIK